VSSQRRPRVSDAQWRRAGRGLLDRLVDTLQNPVRLLPQQLPGGGEFQAAGGSLHKLSANTVLELTERARQSGLRHMQRRGCRSDTALIADRGQGLQVPQLDIHNCQA